MKTNWDYTKLADAYLKRPDYATEAIDRMVATANVSPGDPVCDVGAGTGHLTRLLVERGLRVTAVEPNDAMRANGMRVTQGAPDLNWVEGTAEQTGLPDAAFSLVTFGSSFNTTDRSATLIETRRILVRGGWFACMWNHRDLADPVQASVEAVIRDLVPDYSLGSRREDQTPILEASGLFEAVQFIEASYVATVARQDYMEAWRSHATLERQSQDRFEAVIEGIDRVLGERSTLAVPYTTRLWMARLR